MATSDIFYQLKDERDDLLIAPLNFAVLATPFGVGEIPESIVDPETGALLPLPEGWKSFGEIQKAAGINMAPEMSVTGPEGYGSRGRRRDLIESENFSIELTAQEQRLELLDMAMDVDTTDGVVAAGGKDIRFRKRRTAKLPEYSVIIIGLDGESGAEIYPYWIFPKMTNTQRSSLGMTETNIIEYALKLDMKEDPEHDPFYFGVAGPGTPAFLEKWGLAVEGDGAAAASSAVDTDADGTPDAIDPAPTDPLIK